MRFLGLASRNFKETYRDRLDVSFLLVMPTMFMLLFGVILRDLPFFGGLAFMDFMAPGIIVFGLSFLVMASARLMAADRDTGFLSRLMTAPARPLDFILGYSLGMVALAIAQIIIYIVIAWKLGMSVAGSPWLLLLILILTSLNCIAIGMIIGSLVKSKAQGENLSFLFIFPLMILSGAMFPLLEMMPSYLRNIAYAFPFARAIDAARGVNMKGLGVEALSNDLQFLAGFAVVFFTIGVILFSNCLVVSRIRSMFSYTLALAILAGLLCFGFLGGDLRFTGHVHVEGFGGEPSTPEVTPLSFMEDFEDGKADGWTFGPGWEVRLDNGNHVLSGLNDKGDKWSWAVPRVSGWFNYTLVTRVKLISGKFHLNFRASEVPLRSKYTLGIGEKEFYLNRAINENYLNLTGSPPILKLNEWQQLKVILNGTNIRVYLDDELKLDYTDSDFPLMFGGFSFDIAPNSHAFFDDINVNVGELTQMTPTPIRPTPTPTPAKPTFEAKEYANKEYGFSIKYPKEYVEKEPVEPGVVFSAVSLARAPAPFPQVNVLIGDVGKGTTFAGLKEEIRFILEATGGKDIKFVSEKETTLADGMTLARELVVEWTGVSPHGQARLRVLTLWVIKGNRQFGVLLIDLADFWHADEAELREVGYSLQFK